MVHERLTMFITWDSLVSAFVWKLFSYGLIHPVECPPIQDALLIYALIFRFFSRFSSFHEDKFISSLLHNDALDCFATLGFLQKKCSQIFDSTVLEKGGKSAANYFPLSTLIFYFGIARESKINFKTLFVVSAGLLLTSLQRHQKIMKNKINVFLLRTKMNENSERLSPHNVWSLQVHRANWIAEKCVEKLRLYDFFLSFFFLAEGFPTYECNIVATNSIYSWFHSFIQRLGPLQSAEYINIIK